MSAPRLHTASPLRLARRMVQRRTQALMGDRIKILRGQLGTLDPLSGLVGGLTHAVSIYPALGQHGIARIHTVTGEGSIALGEGQLDVRQVIISIPEAAAAVHRDDLVQVLVCLADPDMVGRALRVLEVAGGTLLGDARRLSCTMWNPSRRWSGTGTDVP